MVSVWLMTGRLASSFSRAPGAGAAASAPGGAGAGVAGSARAALPTASSSASDNRTVVMRDLLCGGARSSFVLCASAFDRPAPLSVQERAVQPAVQVVHEAVHDRDDQQAQDR